MATPRSLQCCKRWSELTDRERSLSRWQVLHQLCHSKIPFTADRFVEASGLSLRDARGMLNQVRAAGWVIEMPNTNPRLYNGLLPKR